MSRGMCYFARAPECGHIVVVMADVDPTDSPDWQQRWRRHLAKETADCIRRGFTVERVTHEAFHAEGMCPDTCHRVAAKQAPATQTEMAL